MKVKHFLLFFLSCFVLFHARADYSVYVTYSWLDGEHNYSSEGVIWLQGSSTWHSPVSCKQGSILVTTVPSGHDVCWSYDGEGRDKIVVMNKGHYAHYPENSGKDWFAWPLAEGGAVGVHFDWLKYSISFNGNGGSNSMAPMDGCVYNQPTNLTKNTFAKTGYSFTGWTNVATSVVFTDGARIKGDDFPTLAYTNKVVELYAAWKPNDYMVTFDANGGSVAPASKSVTYDSTYGDLPTPAFNGHTFAGWYTEVTGGSKIESTTKVAITSNQTLYARWNIGQFSIEVFRNPNCEGNGTTSGGGVGKDYGSEVTIQANPSTGSHFTRWNDGNEAATRKIIVYSNATYYATFDLNYESTILTVSLNPGEGASVDPHILEYEKGQTYGKLPTPTRKGYKFLGWYTSVDEGEAQITSSTPVTITAPQTLCAHWEANTYRVSFNTNGGGAAPSSVKVTYDGTYGELPSLTRTGYVFEGWWTDDKAGIKILSESTVKILADQTLYAHWSPAAYTVTINDIPDEFTLNAPETGTYTKPLELTWNLGAKTGYTLQSFAITLSADGVTKLLATYTTGTEATYTMTGAYYTNVNLTAASDYTPNHYKVCFYPNGGNGDAFTREFVYDVAQILPTPAFSRRGYELAGWALEPTEAARFELNHSVSNLSSIAGAIVGLYAKWKPTGTIAQTDFNRALKCENLKFEVTSGEGWHPDTDYATTSSLGTTDSTLSTVLDGPGLLTFRYRLAANTDYPSFSVFKAISQSIDGFTTIQTNMDNWAIATYTKGSSEKETIRWVLRSRSKTIPPSYAYLSNVTWTPSDATAGVTFRLNDGTLAPADIFTNMTRTVNLPIGELPVVVREGFEFLGWFTAASGGDLVGTNWLVPAGEVQLYAHWTNSSVQPTAADRRDISSVTMENGEIALSFENADSRFAYSLHGTNDLTAARALWPVLFTTNDTGTITIKPAVKAGEKQFFYYLEVHSK